MRFSKCIPSVACFSDAIVCLKNDGTLWAIGANTNGRFGVDPSTTASFSTWTQLGMDNVKHVFAVNNNGLYVTRRDEEVWYTGFPAKSRVTGIYTTSVVNTWTQAPVKCMRGCDVWNGNLFIYTENGSLYSTMGIDSSCGYRTQLSALTKSTLLTDIVQIAGTSRTYDLGSTSSHTGSTYVYPVLVTANGNILWRATYGYTAEPFSDSGRRVAGDYIVSNTKNVESCYINIYKNVYTSSGKYVTNKQEYCGMIHFKNGTVKSFVQRDTGYGATSDYAPGRWYGFGFSDLDNHNLTTLSITNVKQMRKDGYYRTFFLKNDGTVWVCGDNANGVLCTNNNTQQIGIQQAQVDNVDRISGYSGKYTVFLKKSGDVIII